MIEDHHRPAVRRALDAALCGATATAPRLASRRVRVRRWVARQPAAAAHLALRLPPGLGVDTAGGRAGSEDNSAVLSLLPPACLRAPEPSDILWQHTACTGSAALTRRLASAGLTLLIVAAGAGVQYGLAVAGEDERKNK